MRKPIFVAGHAGQVARALTDQAIRRGNEIVKVGRPALDITDPASVCAAFDAVNPGLVINAAGFTAVDAAETDAATAFAVNRDGAEHVAREAAARGIPVFHLSTDYVFGGKKPGPYTEIDGTAPIGVYGQSKVAGERAVAAANPRHLILRTAWVYSSFGKNFAKTMLRLAETRSEIGVVDDQFGNPTSANDIAEALLTLAGRAEDLDLPWGVYHLAADGETSWAGFAREIFAVSKSVGGPVANVNSITTAEYPTPTRRPANSRLDTSKLAETFGIRLPHWTASTKVCIERLVAEKAWTS